MAPAPSTAPVAKTPLPTSFPPNIWPPNSVVFDDIDHKRAFINANGRIFSAGHVSALLQVESVVSTAGSALTLHRGVQALRTRAAEESDEVGVAHGSVVMHAPAQDSVASVVVAADIGEFCRGGEEEEQDGVKSALRRRSPQAQCGATRRTSLVEGSSADGGTVGEGEGYVPVLVEGSSARGLEKRYKETGDEIVGSWQGVYACSLCGLAASLEDGYT
jgi:hypothetical protein